MKRSSSSLRVVCRNYLSNSSSTSSSTASASNYSSRSARYFSPPSSSSIAKKKTVDVSFPFREEGRRRRFSSSSFVTKAEKADASSEPKTTILYTTTHEKLTIQRSSLLNDDDDESSTNKNVSVAVAISDFGFDKIGDVLQIEKKVLKNSQTKNEFIENETSLATLKWSGFHRTAADELYHSLWSNVNGTRHLKLPFPVTNVRFNDEMVREAYKLCVPSASILECEAIGEEVEKCSDLMNESEYEKFIDRELEEEENASYKSYP
ncbi:unnamed protein product [Bathycoccus prasinos]|jgi:hypothetical protein